MKKPLRPPSVWSVRPFQTISSPVAVSDKPLSQHLGLCGFDATGDYTMKVLRSELDADRPQARPTASRASPITRSFR